MQSRATKVFLPQNYQQYLAQKKKVNRLLSNKHAMGHHQASSNNNPLHKQNNFFGCDNDRSNRNATQNHNALPLIKGNNNLPRHGFQNDGQRNNNNLEESQISSDGQGESSSPINKKQTRIVQKIVYSEYKTLFQQFQNNKFEWLKRKIQVQLIRLKQNTPLQPLKVNQILKQIQLQSLQNIIQIQKQMMLPLGRRNSQKLDNMLSFNKFFVILNREKRYRIYQNCSLRKCQPDQVIYSEGQSNQHMYVVVKGCVKQYETKSTSYQDKVQVNFLSYYQGSNLGEAPLVGDPELKGRRYNTTQATQQTYLLQLTNSFYKELITNSAEDDFQKKIQALMQTSIFRDTSKMFITPLLPTLTKHILHYGTVLIRQGQQVRHLYFVAQGNLQVMLLDRAKRNIKHLNIQQKPKNFYLKKSDASFQSNKKQKEKQKSFSIHTKFYYPENTDNQQKQFMYGNKKLVGQNQLQYNDQIVFQTLRMGDFFGGKSFLQQIERENKMMASQHFDTSLRSKLSVLSSSPKAVVYSIDQKKFFSLSDNFQKMIIQGIMQAKYFDEQDIQVKAQGQKEWKKYAQKLVGSVIAAKKNNRCSSFRT